MKIVVSSDIYYPMINGVAVFSRNLAAGMKKRGHQVLVLAPSIDGDFKIEKDTEFGFTVVRLSSRKMHLYPDQINKVPDKKTVMGHEMPSLLYKNGLNVSFAPYKEIKRVLDDFQPDIIHNQTPGPVALAVLRYAKKHNIHLVSTDHAYPDNLTQQIKLPELAKKPINKLMNQYFISFLKRSEYATMPTEQAVADLIPKNRKHFKVPVEALSNGIDLSRFAKGKVNADIYERFDIPKGKQIILYVGRVDPEKSLHILLNAFIEVTKDHPNAHLVIVGDGTARSSLEKIASDNNISDKTHFLGRIIGDDLPQIYRAGSIFATTSKTETQCIVAMEAMATGLPVIVVKAGALPELVKSGENGFVCEPDNVTEISTNISKILDDTELREKMSQESLKRIKKHDISYTLTRIEEIYDSVIESAKQ